MSDISNGIGFCETLIGDLGLSQSPARSTMSDGNKKRNWKVYESLYNKLLKHYERVLKSENQRHIIEDPRAKPKLATQIKDHSIKLIDSTVISLCLSMFDWAKFTHYLFKIWFSRLLRSSDNKRRIKNIYLL